MILSTITELIENLTNLGVNVYCILFFIVVCLAVWKGPSYMSAYASIKAANMREDTSDGKA
ncbi:hypothetical protein S4054249_09835 [Pseudoalteromonas luteoviolacea]|uniref:Uncharacterized protein n=1 Tax=Pseudoalteromonas luteoviolacea S4054 TaxID=1129367 RepID=A0A0F6AEC8_9GAMM|nr:hypothetical protein S4054249_09835 [Pseudoalteromonas luteoviolacea]AOT13043.1 hypothetical protein S40542_09835 [Pseudoalteromonas luteoviolacea]AOT17955.1 hypothetical protein S4054_09830 [Pseudoalteromonas luteoviolacea]KKE84513.1 hypothetical protein N479_08805 [Pseudoalteromonas luteoviolacea S4054]KZN69513.1 hypothetical protein N481_22235 [Pseudoalteromonas luteoviolacea S4047-1]